MAAPRRKCRTCGRRRSLSAFGTNYRRGRDDFRYHCRDCAHRVTFAGKLRTRYGLSVHEYAMILNAQDYRCRICSEPFDQPHVDHDHTTGEVRGLLCSRCNRGVGHFRDCPDLMAAAIRYLSTPHRWA